MERSNYGDASIHKAAAAIIKLYEDLDDKLPKKGYFPTGSGPDRNEQESVFAKRIAYLDCLRSMSFAGLIEEGVLDIDRIKVNPVVDNLPAGTDLTLEFIKH